MEARAGHVQLAPVGGHLRSSRLQERAIADGAVADAGRPGLRGECLRSQATRFAPQRYLRGTSEVLTCEREDLAAPSVDDRQRAGCPGRERVESRHPGDGQAEAERQPPRGSRFGCDTATRPIDC